MISFSIVICSFKLFVSNGSFGHFCRATLATCNFFLKSSLISKSSPCKLQTSQQQLNPQFNNFSLLESRNNDADSMSKYLILISSPFSISLAAMTHSSPVSSLTIFLTELGPHEWLMREKW